MTKKIQARNKEQEAAIKAGIDFIEHGDPEDFFIIGGKAGTGKTTIVEAILSNYVHKKNILVCALSHKAKLVISEKLFRVYGEKRIVSKSIASALGMNMDSETGQFILSKSRTIVPIKSAHIIIVDEGSMINEEAHGLIMAEKKPEAKVIYLGDIRQLPPIRQNNSLHHDKPSPIFFGKNYSILHERIRQGEQSAILPFADYFGDNSRLKNPVADPVPPSGRKNMVTPAGALVFAADAESIIKKVAPLYKYAVDKKDMNVIKMVTYRNEKRKRLNDLVRKNIFGRNSKVPYVKGDLLIFHDNFLLVDDEEAISNSYEIQVISAEQVKEEYLVWRIQFEHEDNIALIKVLDSSEMRRHAADVSALFEAAKKHPLKSFQRMKALTKAWALKNKYAPVDYSYAITSHKCQGSAYNTVIVDEQDILSVTMISNKAKSQSMYTALTRASVTYIVLNGQPADKSLSKAIKLSVETLKAEK